MTSYRLILCLIISLTSFDFAPGSVSKTESFQIPGTKPYQNTPETALKSKSLNPPFNLGANAKSPGNSYFLEFIAKGENKGRSKKDLIWLALIILSTVFGAAIFAGLFYLLTNPSVEIESEESTNPENSDPKSSAELNPQDLSDELNSETHIDSNVGEIYVQNPEATAYQTGAQDATTNQIDNHKNISENSQNIQSISEQPLAANRKKKQSDELGFTRKIFLKIFSKKSEKKPANQSDIKPINPQNNDELLKSQINSEKPPDIHPEKLEIERLPNIPGSTTSLPQGNQAISLDPGRESLAISENINTTRLAKIDIIEELIRELQNPDPIKRRKCIWELSQRGDSRAIQPLVNLMIDSDSKQSSLILGALSEIGTRTIKPINRALALSLQDHNADVRKNAIRDLTRIYDLINQITQLLNYAVNDTDPEVQETARWALSQLSKLSKSSGYEVPSALPNVTNIGDNSPE
ncbi:HEAT repeat domain-containing protein [Planktothricoides sp. SR001]|uniref:HEAT repeat domain-containing protein n=1 Tax=Planktothricoides sp. SR001 TaxID=1705388 RepID=UPI0006C88B23|nr:HEAT repeat domain-containing protein [Planktothricoides sp. SR001]